VEDLYPAQNTHAPAFGYIYLRKLSYRAARYRAGIWAGPGLDAHGGKEDARTVPGTAHYLQALQEAGEEVWRWEATFVILEDMQPGLETELPATAGLEAVQAQAEGWEEGAGHGYSVPHSAFCYH